MKFTTVIITISLICFRMIAIGQNVIKTKTTEKEILTTPQNIQASDGLYPKHIEVKWEWQNLYAADYKYVVYRSESPKSIGEPIGKTEGQVSTWLEDSDVEPGIKYFYRVIVRSDDHRQSSMSDYNSGYTKPVAAIRPKVKSPELWIHNIELKKDNIVKPNEAIDVIYQVQNKATTSVPSTQIRFYLSLDDSFDWEDTLLDHKHLYDFPAQTNTSYRHQLTIPEQTFVGTQYLLMVSAVDGKILESKVNVQKLIIE